MSELEPKEGRMQYRDRLFLAMVFKQKACSFEMRPKSWTSNRRVSPQLWQIGLVAQKQPSHLINMFNDEATIVPSVFSSRPTNLTRAESI